MLETVEIELSSVDLKIDSYAFQKCSNVTKVTILPKKSTFLTQYSIGQNAFAYCESLKEVNFDIRQEYDLADIGDSAFRDCKSLTDFTIPNGLTHLPFCCFYKSGLVSIYIPKSV